MMSNSKTTALRINELLKKIEDRAVMPNDEKSAKASPPQAAHDAPNIASKLVTSIEAFSA